VADRLRQTVESHAVVVDGARIEYTVSGGVAAMDPGMTSLDELMKRADDALYAAKMAGRNRIESWAPVNVALAAGTGHNDACRPKPTRP